ncbi:MAG TPA: 50S ribosomal protein L23 [Polyangiaceae bacterium LLY-WYZ-15_(1-7)]|nr:50S ribosomal protein L23 [Sandaracinus sp.]HJK90656.1 50S ribosomal protein L23 [Polyangiaceae bacterium LLY-WYZ-15_(1-7)]MBJ74672.1 50S ribosomal protein L23 [Sandaracinus sp.]HJL00123.1 50S ribosomal protein L23 [Polyangiaceae bacterium LLY-WYZ-15_(1-7)]HJL08871.1 50S ribosomal protein L23 [Polyangiaceae bacterium LLY-WYZ-15_(1-7)]
MQIEDVIKRPLILTEKGSILRDDENKYLFEVDLRANKIEIKKAVEELFKVNVLDVNTLIVRGKPKRMGRRRLKTRNWKKAIVTLGPDDSIDFYEGA